MAKTVYLEGIALGQKTVRKWLDRIYIAKSTEELGKIAGEALLEISIKEDAIAHYTFIKTDSFREGFFDGFIDRAEEFGKKKS